MLAINQTSYYDMRCGGGVHDLSDLTASDLSYNQGYFTWVLRVCGAVSSPKCANSSDGYETAMLCQVTPTSVYAASYNEPTRSLWNIIDTGLALTVQNGGYRGPGQGYVRETVVNFVCDPLVNGTSSITAMVEQPTCVYIVTVATDAVCSGSNYVPGASSPSSPSSSSSFSSPQCWRPMPNLKWSSISQDGQRTEEVGHWLLSAHVKLLVVRVLETHSHCG